MNESRAAPATKSLMRRAVRRWQRLIGARGIERRLVWILGSPRSGSTWLLRMLGEHDAVVPINEPLIGSYLGPFLVDLAGVRHDWFDSSNFTLRRAEPDEPNRFFAEQFRDVWLRGLGDLMRERFLAQARAYPAAAPLARTLVVIKEPNGSQSADVLMAALPQSRFVFLLRDGRDVVDSQVAANQPGGWVSVAYPAMQGIGEDERHNFVVRNALKWLWTTEVVQQAYAAHPGPKLMLRYEDLRSEPLRHFSALLDWLGLDADRSRVEALVERHAFERVPESERGPKAFHRAATPGLWRENLTDEEQAAVERILGPKLRELGYE